MEAISLLARGGSADDNLRQAGMQKMAKNWGWIFAEVPLPEIWHIKFIKQEFYRNQLLENVLQYLIGRNLPEISVGG